MTQRATPPVSVRAGLRSPTPTSRWWLATWPVGFAVALPLLAFVLFGNVGLGLWDEGFLWYGAQRVLAGEVPQRDFQAYDIGRYYWSAAWMLLLGSDGIVALRAGQAVLASVCLAMATLLVRRELRGPSWLLGVVVVSFWIWLAPPLRLADSFAALLLVAGLSVLLRQRTPGGWAVFGACLGVATGIGINHGAYGTVAGALAIVYCWLADRTAVKLPLLAGLVLGGLAGYLPVLVFHVAVPGYSAAFFDAIRLLFEAGTTNVTIPLPRPDAIWSSAQPNFMHRLRLSVLGLLWVAAGAFLLWGTARVMRGARESHFSTPPVHAASLFVAVPYCHYFLSRAEVVHFGLSALPILVAAWTYPIVRRVGVHRTALFLVTACAGLLSLPEHSGYHVWRGKPHEWVSVRGEKLRLEASQAADVRLVQQTVQAHAPADHRMFYVAPYWAGAYAIAGRRSPTWEIYLLFPALPYRQREEIKRLIAADISFALLTPDSMDWRPDLGLKNTHPLIVEHLERCMRPAPLGSQTHPGVRLLVPADAGCHTKQD